MCKFPLPAELIAVVGGTLISSILNLGQEHNVKLVGDIPMGLPAPELPPVKLLWLVAVDSIAIAIVSYTVTISMALIFAKKQNYEVRPNQELLAMVSLGKMLCVCVEAILSNRSTNSNLSIPRACQI